ncbi:putative Na+-dependent transporter [Belliella baltica DSM 15883]|uniref:Putative Na+-dependent transporter n=1 Tax=Belliella baltica (strain DSM 15883 / CIP 108006 / LMG 21964 / BA134) TaxID=866536 RepID=I3Z861_BELBD|nr:bile acid:sodium symporter family protein [Belliella baltica]AFL85429.1 putative Na+-dependent transporter [Belliella baltica DSM 15883]
MLERLDSSTLNFDQDSLLLLNISLAIIMFGVALDLKISDFTAIAKNPKSFIAGIISQFIFLPFLTWVFVLIITPPPSVALGMFLVAACPGGNVSNFISHLAKGNAALSVSLTAFSTLFSIFLTPFNFALWAGFYAPSADLMRAISLDYIDIFQTVALILGVPLILGILINNRFPVWSKSATKILKPLSIFIFAVFVGIAFVGNYSLFIKFIGLIFLWVFGHNLMALFSGFSLAKIFKLNLADTKTLTIETGIQNSGLGLVLIFTYFDGLGGMAIIAAWWGIWHIISGMGLAFFWKKSI